MAIGPVNFPVHEAPTSDYPSGNIKDRVGTNPGTKVNKNSFSDVFQFFAKFLRILGVSPNATPDNESNGFQYVQAVIDVMHQEITEGIFKALYGVYTTNDLVIMGGCTITPNIPGSSTITAGSIYYNGKTYKVPAATVVTTGSDTLVFVIDNTVTPSTIKLAAATSGSGIANYDSTTVKPFITKWINGNTNSGFTFVNPTASLIGSMIYQYKIINNIAYFEFQLAIAATSGPGPLSIIAPLPFNKIQKFSNQPQKTCNILKNSAIPSELCYIVTDNTVAANKFAIQSNVTVTSGDAFNLFGSFMVEV